MREGRGHAPQDKNKRQSACTTVDSAAVVQDVLGHRKAESNHSGIDDTVNDSIELVFFPQKQDQQDKGLRALFDDRSRDDCAKVFPNLRAVRCRAVHGGAGALTFIFILRGMAAPFSHPLFTSMTGIGLGWSRQSNNGFIKEGAPGLGFMPPLLMHATWNGSAVFGGGIGFFVSYFLIMGPAFIITLLVIFFSLRREGRIVRQFLYPEYQRGFFDPSEYERLCTIHGRMGMSWTVLIKQGFSMWRTRMRCNQLTSELAFHRSRVARGFGRDPQQAQQRENEYLSLLDQLRRNLASGQMMGR